MQTLTFSHEGTRVVQTEPDGSKTSFDPLGWGSFTRGSLVVHAVRIPRPFKVGAETCKDGYLVFDGKLKAISSHTFSIDYKPLSHGHVLGDRAAA
jgi:hypothetical protein